MLRRPADECGRYDVVVLSPALNDDLCLDITLDSLPVIGPSHSPGFTLATGFSGHCFGTAPARGQFAADPVQASFRWSIQHPAASNGLADRRQ
jgi:glycine/D-amino acid oxidase-like deaminating enzyme